MIDRTTYDAVRIVDATVTLLTVSDMVTSESLCMAITHLQSVRSRSHAVDGERLDMILGMLVAMRNAE